MKTVCRRAIRTAVGVSSDDVRFRRALDLPFLPVVGMWIHASGEFACKVESVVYDAESGELWVDCGDRRMWDRLRRANATNDEIVAICREWLDEELAEGWEVEHLGMLRGRT